jgi:DNA mismatch repair protein MutS
VRNVSVAAREWKGEVVFLRKLVAGGASRSFGIEVARLAGLPAEVVGRARAILEALEGERPSPAGPSPVTPGKGQAPQLGLFERPARRDPEDHALREIAEALRRVDPDELSPRAAWDLLAELRKKLTIPS